LECLIERFDESYERPQTQREQVLLEQNEQLKDHIRAISHDLRSLFAVAGGHTELAIETGDRSHLDSVSKAVARADELLSQLETLVANGEYPVEPESVDLREIAENAWSVVKTEETELLISESETVTADSGLLRQLLENLFNNSINHAGPGVTVRFGVLPEGGFYIEDDGPGIPPAKRSDVFQLGESGDGDGTGVGLAICKQVADVHGWTIDVTDSSKGGARFEVDTRNS
jgi:signal transduction histidine kinase